MYQIKLAGPAVSEARGALSCHDHYISGTVERIFELGRMILEVLYCSGKVELGGTPAPRITLLP